MPIIRCTVATDGKLIPAAVEFEPWDVIQFKSDQPVHLQGHKSPEIQLDRSLNLGDLIVAGSSAGFQLDPDRAATGPRNPPPPPPGRLPITVWIGLEKSIGGAARRGAGAGAGAVAE